LPLSFTLLQKSKMYLASFQSFAHSLPKTAGVYPNPKYSLPRGVFPSGQSGTRSVSSTRFAASNPVRVNSFNSTEPMSLLSHLREELRPTIKLAVPLVLAELGWMSMSIVDTMMVGRLPNSAVAIGAVALGSNVFTTIALFGLGLLLGLDTLVSQAFGAGQREDCHRSLVNSIYLSIALTPPL